MILIICALLLAQNITLHYITLNKQQTKQKKEGNNSRIQQEFVWGHNQSNKQIIHNLQFNLLFTLSSNFQLQQTWPLLLLLLLMLILLLLVDYFFVGLILIIILFVTLLFFVHKTTFTVNLWIFYQGSTAASTNNNNKISYFIYSILVYTPTYLNTLTTCVCVCVCMWRYFCNKLSSFYFVS